MTKTFKVLAYVLAALVVIQAMAIAFALAGLGHWIDHDHATVNKKVLDGHPSFTGSVGFPIHSINGTMLIPLVVLALIVVALLSKVPGATRSALILLGMVVVQIFLGLISDALPWAILFHALNAFGIFSMALITGYRVNTATSSARTVAA